MKIIGLTGNSGSGKSTVSQIFAENGGYVIDADKIAHENIKKETPAYNEIKEAFGKEILSSDGQIDRKKLGNIVFSDSKKLNTLNEINLKYILRKISDEIDSISKKTDSYKFIVIDAPLLIESGLNSVSNEVWVVCADEKIRLDRIIKRDNIKTDYAKKRLNSQTPQEKLVPYADIVIENNNISVSELKKAVLEKLTFEF